LQPPSIIPEHYSAGWNSRLAGLVHGVVTTARPLAAVRAATIAIAVEAEVASAPKPAISAPATKPKSRQKRWTPTAWRAFSRANSVGDGGEQSRVDHGGADAEYGVKSVSLLAIKR
jgi:hypothetical protein